MYTFKERKGTVPSPGPSVVVGFTSGKSDILLQLRVNCIGGAGEGVFLGYFMSQRIISFLVVFRLLKR